MLGQYELKLSSSNVFYCRSPIPSFTKAHSEVLELYKQTDGHDIPYM